VAPLTLGAVVVEQDELAARQAGVLAAEHATVEGAAQQAGERAELTPSAGVVGALPVERSAQLGDARLEGADLPGEPREA